MRSSGFEDTQSECSAASIGEIIDRRTLAWYRYDNSRSRDGARRWRWGAGVWLIYLLSPLGGAWTHHRLIASIAGTALLVIFAIAYLYLVPTAWSRDWNRRFSIAGIRVTAALLVLSLASIAVIGQKSIATLVFVCAAALVILPTRISLVFAGICAIAATLVPPLIEPWEVQGVDWGDGVTIALAAVLIFSYTSLIRTNHELAAARAAVATLAAERERLRIARDLHDLLGHSLTTVTVKAALARRLVDTDPERAKAEIEQVERLARESLADTRIAVTGYREVRLATELATAREVLAAAGIEADLPRVVDDVLPEFGGLFGWVVREGVTNVVRHSRAQRVRIALSDKAIEIVDDGLGAKTVPNTSAVEGEVVHGNGLAGLAERAVAVGGTLSAGPTAAGGFRVRVEVP